MKEYPIDAPLSLLLDRDRQDLNRPVGSSRKVALAKELAIQLGRLVTSLEVGTALVRIRKARGVKFEWGGNNPGKP